MLDRAPEIGGTFTCHQSDPQWRWSGDPCDLEELEPAGTGETLSAAVGDCLAHDQPFTIVAGVRVGSRQLRWTLWTGERVGTGPAAYVLGRVLDVSGAFQHALSGQMADHLAAALTGREAIDLAKGALMLAYGLDAQGAFEALVWCSQRTNVRVHELAERLVGLLRSGVLAQPSARDVIEATLGLGPAPDGVGATRTGEERAFTLRDSSAGGARVLAAAGAVDLRTAPELATALAGQVEQLAAGDVLLVDLTDVDHLGPAGVSVLESMARRSRALGVELRVVAVGRSRETVNGGGADGVPSMGG